MPVKIVLPLDSRRIISIQKFANESLRTRFWIPFVLFCARIAHATRRDTRSRLPNAGAFEDIFMRSSAAQAPRTSSGAQSRLPHASRSETFLCVQAPRRLAQTCAARSRACLTLRVRKFRASIHGLQKKEGGLAAAILPLLRDRGWLPTRCGGWVRGHGGAGRRDAPRPGNPCAS